MCLFRIRIELDELFLVSSLRELRNQLGINWGSFTLRLWLKAGDLGCCQLWPCRSLFVETFDRPVTSSHVGRSCDSADPIANQESVHISLLYHSVGMCIISIIYQYISIISIDFKHPKRIKLHALEMPNSCNPNLGSTAKRGGQSSAARSTGRVCSDEASGHRIIPL